MKICALLLAFTLLAGRSLLCNASVTLADGNMSLWDISGTITKSDLTDLEEVAKSVKSKKAMPIFRLNSDGGDLQIAIAMGRQLRRLRATAVTFDQGRCYSACVFVLVGAVQRVLASSIGIHRPYSTSTEERDFQTTQSAQRSLGKLAKEYLEEMNVSPALYDAMIATPPENIRLLSEAELHNFGILTLDPVEQELRDAAEARKHGLSKTELLRRKSMVSSKCSSEYRQGANSGDFGTYFQCRNEVIGSGK